MNVKWNDLPLNIQRKLMESAASAISQMNVINLAKFANGASRMQIEWTGLIQPFLHAFCSLFSVTNHIDRKDALPFVSLVDIFGEASLNWEMLSKDAQRCILHGIDEYSPFLVDRYLLKCIYR